MRIFFINILFFVCAAGGAPQKAIVCVPVADLIGEPIAQQKYIKSYAKIPLCGAKPNASAACSRIGQLLFNEAVTVIKTTRDEAFVCIPHLFYITKTSNEPQTCYWMQKKNLFFIDGLKDKKNDLVKIPAPLTFKHPEQQVHQSIVSIKTPWKDPISGTLYSAGTRFVVKNSNETEYTVWILNKKKGTFYLTSIPVAQCIRTDHLTNEQRIDLFIHVLKLWAHPAAGFIPYVWGGTSFCSTSKQHSIGEKFIDKEVSYYTLPDTKAIKDGFDCSGIISRAAQMAGIPYYFKNTHTLAHYLKSYQLNDTVNIGDLIWIPGHVMIISDVANNLLIEARGYGQGYGKVQELPLSEVFKDIATYKDLLNAYRTGKTIQRLNSAHEIADSFKQMKLLKIASVCDTAGY